MAEIWGVVTAGVIAAGGAVAGSEISANASKNAANASANAANQGANAQLQMFNQTQANFAPQVQLGQGAANMLGNIYGIGGVTGPAGSTPSGNSPTGNYSSFYNSPGYQFSLQQGQNAINRQASANGSLYSSNTLGALGSYTAGAAGTQYNSYINQLLSMAGLGNAASSGTGAAATATGQGVANSLQNAGNANASGVLGSSNAYSNGIGAAAGQFGNLLSRYGGSLGGSTSTSIGDGLQNDIYNNSGNYIPPPTFDAPVG